MSKIDDLTRLYRDETAKPEYPGWDEKHRAGIVAVVTALRDEMQTKVCNDGKEECCGQARQDAEGMVCCGRPNYVVTTDHVLDVFNEILGDAVERADEQRAATPTTDLLRMGQEWDAAPTTDYSELVTQLRALSKAEWLIGYGADGNVSRAADALEAQAKEIERLRAVLHLLKRQASEGEAT